MELEPLTGRFIVLEGLDGAGTTTQLDRLVSDRSMGAKRILRTFEPTDGPLGAIARRSLRGDPDAPPMTALPWLFAADRADHFYRTIQPALAADTDVFCDRYVASSLAYQSLTHGMDAIWSLNASFRAPDRVVFVDVDVDTALARIRARSGTPEIYDGRERLTEVHDAYQEAIALLESNGWPVARVDGRPAPDVVFASIQALL